jgi:antitoxin component YwqK of YwqJK toxin-antitoxin module
MDSHEQKFFVSDDGKEKLSITKAELQVGIDSGKHGEKTLAWTKGMSEWLSLSDPSWEKHGIVIETKPPELPPSVSDLLDKPTNPSDTSTAETAISSSVPEAKQNQPETAPKQPAKTGISKVLIGTLALGLAVLGVGGLLYWFFASETNLENEEKVRDKDEDMTDTAPRKEAIEPAVDYFKLRIRYAGDPSNPLGTNFKYLPNEETPFTGRAVNPYPPNNRQKWIEANFKDGKPDGLQTGWWENGQKKYKENWKGGKKDGIWTGWWENGQKKYEQNFKDDKVDGLWTSWHEKNGQKSFEGTYKDDKEDGLLTSWYENGQKKLERNFKDGKLMSAEVWKRNGEKCPVTNLRNGDGLIVLYGEDGTEKYRWIYKDGGRVSQELITTPNP